MRLACTAFLLSFLFLAPFASADTVAELQAKIQSLLAQIQALQSAAQGPQTPAPGTVAPEGGCPALSRSLGRGDRGADVVALQMFLKARGYLEADASGYFGPLTEAALQRLQGARGVVSSGTPASTGYGLAGPRTRAAIARMCAENAAAPAAPAQCPLVTSPTAPLSGCAGTWEKLLNQGCHIGWRCVPNPAGGDQPPVISAINGPRDLAVGGPGAWIIQAVDPEGRALEYSVNWGDENASDVLRALAGLGGVFTSSPNLSHAYAAAGIYSATVTARDPAGHAVSATFRVSVSAEPASPGASFYDPIGNLATSTQGAACVTPWGGQVVSSGGTAQWQPFFTDGAYYATTSPLALCTDGAWLQCDAAGKNCQAYEAPTSTPSTAALPSYVNTIGGSCSPEGSTKQVAVPAGTQLCQWLSCRITTKVEPLTLKCTHSGWTDYAGY